MVTILIIIGPTIGIAAINTPSPTKTSVKTLITKAQKTIIFLSIPQLTAMLIITKIRNQKNSFLGYCLNMFRFFILIYYTSINFYIIEKNQNQIFLKVIFNSIFEIYNLELYYIRNTYQIRLF